MSLQEIWRAIKEANTHILYNSYYRTLQNSQQVLMKENDEPTFVRDDVRYKLTKVLSS
jgi:hypothetical protein